MHKTKGAFNKKSEQNNPLVSIITIVLNSEKTIEKTMQSVLGQTYDNIEYIIVDGGSTDGTLDIIKKYGDNISWISEPDEGISDAFNKGIKLSRGEIIGILNSDDWYELDAVEKVVKAYCADPDIDVIYGDLCFYKGNKPLFVQAPNPKPKRILEVIIYNHPTCFIKRDCYDKFGTYDTNFKFAMDHDLLLRFQINEKKFHYIHSVLTNMTFGGVSDMQEVKTLKETKRAHAKYGDSKYVNMFWIIFALRLLKRFARTLIPRDSFLYKKLRCRYKGKRMIN